MPPVCLYSYFHFSKNKDNNNYHLFNSCTTSEEWSDKLKTYLYHLIKVRQRFLEKYKNSLRFGSLSSIDLIRQVLREFGNTVKKLKGRRKNHKDFVINDEYDVQDLVYVMLKGTLPALIKEEEPTPQVAGKFNRIDFYDSLGTFIEIKIIREKDSNEKEIIEQLKNDIQSYYKYPDLKNIIFFVYDPYNKTQDIHNFYDLNGEKTINSISFTVEVIVSC